MNDFEQKLSTLWTDWNLSTDPDRDPDADTLLLEHSHLIHFRYPDKFFVIDRFPLLIEDNAKIREINVMYDNQNDSALQTYLRDEEKCKRVFQILWAYSPVWMETSLSYENVAQLLPHVTGNKREHATHLHAKLQADDVNVFQATSWLDVETILELSLREKVSSVFLFETLHLCIWSSFDLSMPLYVRDEQTLSLLRTVCQTEGLYVRT